MIKSEQQSEAGRLKLVARLMPIILIGITCIVWFIHMDVPSAHATLFLSSRAPALWLLVLFAITGLVLYVLGLFNEASILTEKLWPHVLLLALWFACWFAIAVNRYNCQEDVNVQARYNAFKTEHRWAE